MTNGHTHRSRNPDDTRLARGMRRASSGVPFGRRPLELTAAGEAPRRLVPIGDVRLPMVDQAQVPASGAQVRISVVKDGTVTEERIVAAGPTGYVSTRFATSHDESTTVRVVPLAQDGAEAEPAREISLDIASDVGEVVQLDRNQERSNTLEKSRASGMTHPSDVSDAELAPEVFSATIIEKNGTCALDFAANVETRQYYFNQIVRREDPGERGSDFELRGVREVPGSAIEAPVSFDLEPVAAGARIRQFSEPFLAS